MSNPRHAIQYIGEQLEHILFGLVWRVTAAYLVVKLAGWLLS